MPEVLAAASARLRAAPLLVTMLALVTGIRECMSWPANTAQETMMR